MNILKIIIGTVIVCFTVVPFSWVLTHLSACLFKKGKLFSSPCLLLTTLITIQLISGGLLGAIIFKIIKLEPCLNGSLVGMFGVTLYSLMINRLGDKLEKEKSEGKSNP